MDLANPLRCLASMAVAAAAPGRTTLSATTKLTLASDGGVPAPPFSHGERNCLPSGKARRFCWRDNARAPYSRVQETKAPVRGRVLRGWGLDEDCGQKRDGRARARDAQLRSSEEKDAANARAVASARKEAARLRGWPGAGEREATLVAKLQEVATASGMRPWPVTGSSASGAIGDTLDSIMSGGAESEAPRMLALGCALDVTRICRERNVFNRTLEALEGKILDHLADISFEGAWEENVGTEAPADTFALALCCHAAALCRTQYTSDASGDAGDAASNPTDAIASYGSFFSGAPCGRSAPRQERSEEGIDRFYMLIPIIFAKFHLDRNTAERRERLASGRVSAAEVSVKRVRDCVIIGALYRVRDADNKDVGVRLRLEAPHSAADGAGQKTSGTEERVLNFWLKTEDSRRIRKKPKRLVTIVPCERPAPERRGGSAAIESYLADLKRASGERSAAGGGEESCSVM